MSKPYFQVGNQIFFNKFQAAHYAGTNNLDIYFNLHDNEFDKCDWSKDPLLTWDQLLDIRARQIEAKNKPIVLNFSGGTDSYTIYKVFERNNIHIDVIYIRIRLDPNSTQHEQESLKKVYDLFQQGLYDKTTKIVTRTEGVEMYESAYSDPDWIWNKGLRYHFSMLGADEESDNYCAKILGTDDFVSISGLEKPRLHFINGEVFSYQEDDTYSRSMMAKNVENFYITPELPELHIKQSYLLLNYIQSLTPTNYEIFNKIHVPTIFSWLDYSLLGCGRFGDLNMSHLQHQSNQKSRLNIPISGSFHGSEYFGRGQGWFKRLVGTTAFKNYTEGIMNVSRDVAGKILLPDIKNFSVKSFRSKYYKLSF